MIRSILVCTDGSPHGDASILYAAHFAKRLNAEVSVLHILDIRMLEGPMMANISGWIGAEPFVDSLAQFRAIMEEKGASVLAAAQSKFKESGIAYVRTRLKWGHPARTILDEEIGAEMLVIGQDGEHDKITGDWTGSTLDRVARHALKPTLIVPDGFTPVEKIMIAYDGSAHASRALREAIEMALALAVPLVICVVVETDDQGRAMDHADTAMRLARAHECAAAYLIANGPAAETLIRKSVELKCGILFAGAHGHGRIHDALLGGTAHALIQKTNVPLMLVR